MRVYLNSLDNGYKKCLRDGFEFLGAAARISSTDRVTIKPNLTFPIFRPGVMTTLEAIQATIEYVKQFTNKITICESDSGGYNKFSMDEVFTQVGLKELARTHGVDIVNMSNASSRSIALKRGPKQGLPLPRLLLDETDLFITMPVPKVHANTGISGAIKNQWGVIQEPALRLKLHPRFKEVIYAVNKAMPRTVAILDGKYGLTRNGPMRGEALELNWFAMGDSVFGMDYLMSELMSIPLRRIPYLQWILRQEKISSLDEITINCDYRPFKSHQFFLEREWTDLPGRMTFNSRFLAFVGYKSVLAKPLHKILYLFRTPFY